MGKKVAYFHVSMWVAMFFLVGERPGWAEHVRICICTCTCHTVHTMFNVLFGGGGGFDPFRRYSKLKLISHSMLDIVQMLWGILSLVKIYLEVTIRFNILWFRGGGGLDNLKLISRSEGVVDLIPSEDKKV